MTDPQIISSLAARSPLPSVSAVISEFRISYQRALRCWVAAGGVEVQPEAEAVEKLPNGTEHDLVKTGDADSFLAIEDGHGEVVLAYCRVCRKGESELGVKCWSARQPAKKVYSLEDF